MLKIRIYLDFNTFWLYNCVKDKNRGIFVKKGVKILSLCLTIMSVFMLTVMVVVCAVKISNDSVDDGIVLTEGNKELVELIYSKRKVWERKSNGSLCQYCYFQNINGELYFICAFDDSTGKQYKITKNGFKEYDPMKNAQGSFWCKLLTPSMPDYNYYASDEEKYKYVGNLVKELQDPQKWQEMKSKR